MHHHDLTRVPHLLSSLALILFLSFTSVAPLEAGTGAVAQRARGSVGYLSSAPSRKLPSLPPRTHGLEGNYACAPQSIELLVAFKNGVFKRDKLLNVVKNVEPQYSGTPFREIPNLLRQRGFQNDGMHSLTNTDIIFKAPEGSLFLIYVQNPKAAMDHVVAATIKDGRVRMANPGHPKLLPPNFEGKRLSYVKAEPTTPIVSKIRKKGTSSD